MARYNHDPSSSLGTKPSIWEKAKDTTRGWITKAVASVALVATATGLAGCGGGDRLAVPEKSPSSSASLDPSESPSASPSSSETVDPEVAARMRAREEYDEQVKKIDKIPYNEFIKLPPEERNKILQAEINYLEKSGRTEDKTDPILYPKDSLPFGDYYKKSPADRDPKKMLTDPFLAVQAALYGRFTYTNSDVERNYEEYAKKLASEAFLNPQMDMDTLLEEMRAGKVSDEEYFAKRKVMELIHKRAEQIRSNSGSSEDDVELWKIKDIEVFPAGQSNVVVDPKTGKSLETYITHFYSYDGNKRGSTPDGQFYKIVSDPTVNRWKIAGSSRSGPILSK